MSKPYSKPLITGRAVRAVPHNGFIPIRGAATGKLCFLFDPDRDLVEIEIRGRKEVIDLAQYRNRGLTE